MKQALGCVQGKVTLSASFSISEHESLSLLLKEMQLSTQI
jgi:hypothetical protein